VIKNKLFLNFMTVTKARS